MPSIAQQFETIHCWLILEDGRRLMARCDPKPNEMPSGYVVVVDRYDIPEDLYCRLKVSMGYEDFEYMRSLVRKEQVDFSEPPQGAFREYPPLYRLGRLEGN